MLLNRFQSMGTTGITAGPAALVRAARIMVLARMDNVSATDP